MSEIRRGSMNAEQAERRREQVREEFAATHARAREEFAWLNERISWLREHPGAVVDDYEHGRAA